MPDIQPVGLDISGASNTECTLIVTDGNKTLTYDIPAPSPPTADTSLGPKAQPTYCSIGADAGSSFNGGTRSSALLCFQGDGALDTLAHGTNRNGCPLKLTLTCAGFTFYDGVTWDFCRTMC